MMDDYGTAFLDLGGTSYSISSGTTFQADLCNFASHGTNLCTEQLGDLDALLLPTSKSTSSEKSSESAIDSVLFQTDNIAPTDQVAHTGLCNPKLQQNSYEHGDHNEITLDALLNMDSKTHASSVPLKSEVKECSQRTVTIAAPTTIPSYGPRLVNADGTTQPLVVGSKIRILNHGTKILHSSVIPKQGSLHPVMVKTISANDINRIGNSQAALNNITQSLLLEKNSSMLVAVSKMFSNLSTL